VPSTGLVVDMHIAGPSCDEVPDADAWIQKQAGLLMVNGVEYIDWLGISGQAVLLSKVSEGTRPRRPPRIAAQGSGVLLL
jgi:hypothetical protein